MMNQKEEFNDKKPRRDVSSSSSTSSTCTTDSSSSENKDKVVKPSKIYTEETLSYKWQDKKYYRDREKDLEKGNSRSSSRDKKVRSRSMSREKKTRSRSRSRDMKKRSRSREKKIRSREKKISRSRSRDKKMGSRSRSRDKKMRSRSRSRDKKMRSRSRSRDKKMRSRSRSRDKKIRSRSRDKFRSRSRSRDRIRERSSNIDKKYDCKGRQERGRLYRRSKSPRHRNSSDRSLPRKGYNKSLKKLNMLEKLGIELKVPEVQPLEHTTQLPGGLTIPSYYNPAGVNPLKYAQQMQKRKLLWGNSQKQATETSTEKPEEKAPETVWKSTSFSNDQDGKVTAKFKRLMGIKTNDDDKSSGLGNSNSTLIKKQEEIFESMEKQYEVARVATHTHRGLGLGFGIHQPK